MTTPRHLCLVDGSGFIFRAYHRLPPLTNPQGIPVGAVYGFSAMLWKLIDAARETHDVTHLAVILDAGKKSFRNDIYPLYKANRPPAPEDLVPQFPLIRDAVTAFGLPCLEQVNYEADDLIASYATRALQADYQVTIVSSDKDLMQLIAPGLTLLDAMHDRRISRQEVIDKFGVPPEALGDALALMGDKTDNIPGVPGIGPKTAAELLTRFGDLESVLANHHDIHKPKLRAALETHAEDARLSRILVTLKSDLDLPTPLDDLSLKIPEAGPLGAFLEAHGFHSLQRKLARLATPDAAPPAATQAAPAVPEAHHFDHAAYETVTTPDRLDDWIARAQAAGCVAVDVETTSLNAMRADLVGISLATAPGQACYIPLAHRDGEGLLGARIEPQMTPDVALARLADLFTDPAILKIGHNIKYDLVVLKRYGAQLHPVDDSMLLSYAHDAGNGGHGLDEAAQRYLDHTPIPFKQVCGQGKSQISFDLVPIDQATAYAAEDADIALRLYQYLTPLLARDGTTRIHQRIDRPLIPVIVTMEMAGIAIDSTALERLSSFLGEEMAGLAARIYALAGEEFTIGSPKQLGVILFEKLGLKSGKKTAKSKLYSTSAQELEKLADHGVEIARRVLDWRQAAKLKSTYADALQTVVNSDTKRVHTSFSLASTSTGRLSSSDPNLQNIPIRTEVGRRIRHAFTAPPGQRILAADYNQIELRLIADMAGVPELQAAYRNDEDIHTLTAREIFPDMPDRDDARRRAKTVNFSILYGISAFGLANQLDIARGEAAHLIEAYFARFPAIRAYMTHTITHAREHGFVRTLFGRKMHTPLINARNAAERQFAERAAVNATVQGTAADIVKRAMIQIPPALAHAGLEETRMLLQVHDELVFEVPADQIDAARPIIKAVMEQAHLPLISLDVPLTVEIGTAQDWGTAH